MMRFPCFLLLFAMTVDLVRFRNTTINIFIVVILFFIIIITFIGVLINFVQLDTCMLKFLEQIILCFMG